MSYNRDMRMVCPLCKEFFHPVRRGQIYCCRAHGWEFRNQTKQMKNEEEKRKRIAQINNLRILVKLQIEGEHYPEKQRLADLRFDFKVLDRCLHDLTKKGSDEKYYQIYGFLLFVSPVEVFVYPPWDEFNLLFEQDD